MLASHINALFFAITDFSSTECEQIKAERDNLRRTYSKWSRKPRGKKCLYLDKGEMRRDEELKA